MNQGIIARAHVLRFSGFMLRMLPVIILAAGLIASYVCYQRLHNRYMLETEGIAASGVVKWASGTGGRSGNSYRISVGYPDRSGHEWLQYFTVFSGQYRAGQAVEVIYLPANPETALLGKREAGETRSQDLFGLVAGIIAVLIGAVMALVVYVPPKRDHGRWDQRSEKK
jgi:hypothetical protein